MKEADTTTPRRPPPCRTFRRDAAATTHSSRRSEQHRIRATRRLPRSRRRDTTTRGGLAHPPLDSTSCVTSKRTPHTGALPRPPQYSPPRIRLKGYRRSGEQRCPAPAGSLSNNQVIVAVSTSPRCFTLASSHRRHSSKPGKSLAPSSDVVPYQVATARLSNPPQSAASLVVP